MHSDKVSTTASETRDRKRTKPIMEKRRRARINASLAELKSLLLEAIQKEGARHSKMEKADILEMTVKHLRDMQRQSFTAAAANDPTVSNKHRLGFSECSQEVSRYLSNIDGCNVELRTQLLDHLANFVTRTESNRSPSPPVTSLPVPVASAPDPPPTQRVSQPSVSPSNEQPQIIQNFQPTPFPTDINNNISTLPATQPVQPTKVVSGLQVIPTKLQTGEIAFILPGNVIGNTAAPNYILPFYTTPNSSPTKATVTMATAGLAAPGSFMTIIPSSEMIQACTLGPVPGNINIVSQPMTTTQSSVSPNSVSDSSMLSMSPPLSFSSNDVRVNTETRHHDVRDVSETRHHERIHFGDVMDLREAHKDKVDDICDLRHQSARSLGEVRHHDVRDFNGFRQQQMFDQQVWRPW